MFLEYAMLNGSDEEISVQIQLLGEKAVFGTLEVALIR
jgi:hypothetical protein